MRLTTLFWEKTTVIEQLSIVVSNTMHKSTLLKRAVKFHYVNDYLFVCDSYLRKSFVPSNLL